MSAFSRKSEVFFLGLISKVLPSNTPYYYHYDSRDSTIALTDPTQTQTDAYAYDSFGTVISSMGSTSNPFKYVGGYGVTDKGNGLKYIRARYYSPETRRFITKDPITGKDGDSRSLNRYVYAFKNSWQNITTASSSDWNKTIINAGTSTYAVAANTILSPLNAGLRIVTGGSDLTVTGAEIKSSLSPVTNWLGDQFYK